VAPISLSSTDDSGRIEAPLEPMAQVYNDDVHVIKSGALFLIRTTNDNFWPQLWFRNAADVLKGAFTYKSSVDVFTLRKMAADGAANERTKLELHDDKIALLGGNVGIGTTNPQTRLDVDGTGRFTGALAVGAYVLPATDGTAGQVLTTNGTGIASWQTVSGGGSGYWTASGDDIYNSNTGTITLKVDGSLFLHNYGNANTFLGKSAGNTTTTGFGYNVGVGAGALNAIGAGIYNTGVGASTLQNNAAGIQNTAVGSGALTSNVDADENTAVGAFALGSLAPTTSGAGDANTAVGSGAMMYSTTGKQNTAVGCQALGNDPGNTGDNNTAVGYVALFSNTSGVENTALGQNALYNNTTAYYNTALGQAALYNTTTGGDNTGVGQNAGDTVTTGTQNTLVGSTSDVLTGTLTNATALGYGAIVDASNKVQIGNSSVTEVEIEGIHGSTSASGIAVYVNSDGVLGTTTSSARFKTAIADVGESSEILYDLRPVTFAYRPEIDPSGLTQFGLIAEEVAEVAPDLVIYDDAGNPYTVRYEQLVPLLLNELQKKDTEIASQGRQIEELRGLIQGLNTRLVELETASPR
jgi:hypothetical protein